jgi:hypothetical protein
LDYFLARYYSSAQGRFTGVDPHSPVLDRQDESDKEKAEEDFRAYLGEPQHWNRYPYTINNPLRYFDPNGGQELESIKRALSRVTIPAPIARGLTQALTVKVLTWIFGPTREVLPGGLDAREVGFAKEVSQFTQNTFVGVSTRNEPGIDGILTVAGSYTDVKGVASLTETARANPRVLIDLAGDKERSAGNAGYKQVDLFIKATSLDSKTVLDYVNRGPGFSNVVSRGTIRSINIFTNDGKVVRVDGKKVTVCDGDGKCQ